MTLTYQNTGTSNAYDVVITDALDSTRVNNLTPFTAPPGFAYSTSGTNPVTIRYAAVPGVAVLPGGAPLVFQLDFTLASGNVPGDVIPNTANVTQTTTLDSSTADGDDANERNTTTSASADLQFNGTELAITKDDGGITTAPGSNVSYTVSYSNYGNLPATNVVLRETVPANTSYDSANNTTAWVCGANPAPAGTACTFAIGPLVPGANGSVPFVITVANPFPATITQISNTASITSDQPETVYTDNTATDTTPLATSPALTITKDDHVQIVAPDKVVTYDIRVTNTGNQDLANLVMVDTTPPGMSFVSASSGGTFNSGTSQITWPLYNLASGKYVDFTVSLKVNALASLTGITSFLNTVHVQDDGTNTTGVPVESQATDTDQLASAQVKSLTGTDQVGSADPNVLIGEILDYSIRIDIPIGAVQNLKAVDILDHGLAFVGCDTAAPILPGGMVLEKNPCTDPTALTVQAEPVTDTNPASVNAGRHITFNFGQVQNSTGSTQSLIVNYRVIVLDIKTNANDVGHKNGLNNTVVWSWEGGELSGQAPEVFVVEPDLSIDKSVKPAAAMLGTLVTFSIDVQATTVSAAPAYDVLMTDPIPAGLKLEETSIHVKKSAGLPDAVVKFAAAKLTVFWAYFPVGEKATVTFDARFIGPSPVINKVNLQWSSIPIEPLPPFTQRSPYNRHSTERSYDPQSSTLNDYGTSASATLREPALPSTGFAPGVRTVLPAQPFDLAYDAMDGMILEIPALHLMMPIVGVPATPAGWDLTWLSSQAGYLEGTTFPTQVGTTGLTGHVYLADGTPGPFVHLGDLMYGNQVIVHANGKRYIYEVRTNRVVLPSDLSVFDNDGYTWLTLLTCKEYLPTLKTYDYRLAVRAVLVKVEEEPQP
jgi:large repetitive protein